MGASAALDWWRAVTQLACGRLPLHVTMGHASLHSIEMPESCPCSAQLEAPSCVHGALCSS